MKSKNLLSYSNIYFNEPMFYKKTEILLNRLKSFSKDELGESLKIKGKLLEDTFSIYQNFSLNEELEAILLYDGVSYRQILVEEFKDEEYKYIYENIFIFSALYGILNGTTKIRPYRVDMTNKILDISSYQFWSECINSYLEKFKDEYFLNLASKEFSKIVDSKKFTKVIDVEFRQVINKNLKNISTEAKKARGLMLNYMINNKIKSLEDIKKFSDGDYRYSEKLSTKNTLYFVKGEA